MKKYPEIHPGYSFSTDYRRLLELIEGGHEIICWAEFHKDMPALGLVRFIQDRRWGYEILCREAGYDNAETSNKFITLCSACKMRFIDPEAGKGIEQLEEENKRLHRDMGRIRRLANRILDNHDYDPEFVRAVLYTIIEHTRQEGANGR